jgi:cyclic beta-1,2-glucan synthetase
MYRLILESLLGLRRDGDSLHFAPCLPPDWDGFKLHYRYRETVYRIAVTQVSDGKGVHGVTVDGGEHVGSAITPWTTAGTARWR